MQIHVYIFRAGPSRCGAPLSSDFMTSWCSLNRVTIVEERRCKALTRESSTFANVLQQRKFASSDESFSSLTMKFIWRFY